MKTGMIFTSAAIQEMSRGDVKSVIGNEKYKAIRSQDSHPLFVALGLAHEGKSYGRIIGRRGTERGAEKIWPRSRIHELINLINRVVNPGHWTPANKDSGPLGIPLYLFHNKDNSPRSPVGRLVAAVTRNISGRAHALGIGYITDPGVREKIKAGELDTCSIEAELEFRSQASDSGPKQWIVNAVKSITGVALGSRAFQNPGFAGAGILAAVQEFNQGTEDSGEDIRVVELEKSLRQRDEEIRNLEAEVQRFKSEADSNRKAEEVVQIAKKYIEGRNLSGPERSFILDDLKELSHYFGKDDGKLEEKVVGRVKSQLERVEQMRRCYNSSVSIPAPPERGSGNTRGKHGIDGNPLIPRN